MFGNRLGWGISGLIILGVLSLLWWVHKIGTQFCAPGFIGQNADRWIMQIPTQPRSLATWMTERRSSSDLYKQMIAEYIKNEIAFDRYKGETQGTTYEKVKLSIDPLLQAASASQGGVFADRPEAIITYDTDKPELKAIAGIRMAALKLAATAVNNKDKAKAREIYQAIFSLGIKLYEERFVFEEWHQGRECLAAAIGIGRMTDSPEEKEKFERFDAQFADFFRQYIQPVQKQLYIANPDPSRFPEHATWGGDIASLAVKGGDIMWKIEGIFALGRCKYNGITSGDMFAAKRLLEQLSNSNDRYIKLAASQAKDLTVENFHRLTATSE